VGTQLAKPRERRQWRIDGDAAYYDCPQGSICIDAADAQRFDDFYPSVVFARGRYWARAICATTRKTCQLGRVIAQPTPSQVVDHIDGDPLNNRRTNLRIVSQKQNTRNRAKHLGAATTSIFKGVSKHKNRWVAMIYVDRRARYLGSFLTPNDAAEAYDAAAREMFGSHATLNFPRDGEQSAHRGLCNIHTLKSAD
jgi:hypothetical protein